MNNIFGKRLRMLRREKDIVMTDFANPVGLTQTTVSKYENGHSVPNIDIIKKIAQYFDVSTDYLIGKTDSKDPYDHEGEEFLSELRERVKQKGYDISNMSEDFHS
ncbi:MAG TPA: XRE family transcriptional regulator [Tissierellales bacterium]|nr:XRE family transcriptional regulator [Tissierellales bacterium]